MEDMRRFVSFVNWHLTFLLEHSEQLAVSVASHFTLRSLQASQLGSFLLCLYALFWACMLADDMWLPGAPGVPLGESLDAIESIPGSPGELLGAPYGWGKVLPPRGKPAM
jgi:hypothetical protein